jgi:hypothetical protein
MLLFLSRKRENVQGLTEKVSHKKAQYSTSVDEDGEVVANISFV